MRIVGSSTTSNVGYSRPQFFSSDSPKSSMSQPKEE